MNWFENWQAQFSWQTLHFSARKELDGLWFESAISNLKRQSKKMAAGTSVGFLGWDITDYQCWVGRSLPGKQTTREMTLSRPPVAILLMVGSWMQKLQYLASKGHTWEVLEELRKLKYETILPMYPFGQIQAARFCPLRPQLLSLDIKPKSHFLTVNLTGSQIKQGYKKYAASNKISSAQVSSDGNYKLPERKISNHLIS